MNTSPDFASESKSWARRASCDTRSSNGLSSGRRIREVILGACRPSIQFKLSKKSKSDPAKFRKGLWPSLGSSVGPSVGPNVWPSTWGKNQTKRQKTMKNLKLKPLKLSWTVWRLFRRSPVHAERFRLPPTHCVSGNKFGFSFKWDSNLFYLPKCALTGPAHGPAYYTPNLHKKRRKFW